MRRKIRLYLLMVLAVFAMLVPANKVYAAGEEDFSVNEKNGLEPIVATELTDEEVATIEELRDNCVMTEYYIAQEEREYWLQFSSTYYYENYLNEVEKQFWDALTEKALEMVSSKEDYGYYNKGGENYRLPNNEVYYDATISEKKVKEMMVAFQYSNPQFYFISNGYSYSPSASKVYLLVYKDFADGDTRAQCTATFRAVADAILQNSTGFTTQEEKVKFVHDVICLNTVYLKNDLDQSAYSMLVLQKTVCAGYTKTMTMLLNAMGVECISLIGPDHGWNAVKIHDVWYEMDVTWDDMDSNDIPCVYRYFNKSSQTFENSNHVKQEPYLSMELGANFDSLHQNNYISSYVVYNGNKYFVMNANPYLDFMLVKRVEGTAPLAQKVTYQGLDFYVLENVQQVKAFVERMYTVALGRASDPSGIDFWAEQLLTHQADGARISEGFILSSEFAEKNYSNTDYLKVLYRTFFNREADEGGVAYWLGEMSAGRSRRSVLAGFVNSVEFTEICESYGIDRGTMADDATATGAGRFVERLYTIALERPSDPSGLESWAQRINDKTVTPEQVAKEFFLSPEYIEKNTSNDKYVETLYLVFMDRTSEGDGKVYWVGQLEQGMSREAVLEGFAQSREFKEIMARFGL